MKDAMTLEEAEKFRYFRWSGNPGGTKYVHGRCAYEVWAAGRAMHAYQCLRKNGHGPDGLYCKQHAKKVI